MDSIAVQWFIPSMSTSPWDETRAPPARAGTSDNYHNPPAIDPFRDAATAVLRSPATRWRLRLRLRAKGACARCDCVTYENNV